MTITAKFALQKLINHTDLEHDEMLDVMRQVMRGEFTPAQIAGLLIGLRVKVETVDEIAAAAQVMRELVTRVQVADSAQSTRRSMSLPPRHSWRPALAPESPSMAIGQPPQKPVAPMCWRRWGSI
jgi:hypothetical protein